MPERGFSAAVCEHDQSGAGPVCTELFQGAQSAENASDPDLCLYVCDDCFQCAADGAVYTGVSADISSGFGIVGPGPACSSSGRGACPDMAKAVPLVFLWTDLHLCVLLILSFGHVDYFIAKYNLGRTEEEMISVQETGTTDYDYLSGLSADAAPAIHQAMKDGRIDTASFASAEERTNSWLYSYVYLLNLETTDSWRQFNVSHAYARSLFSEEIEKQ